MQIHAAPPLGRCTTRACHVKLEARTSRCGRGAECVQEYHLYALERSPHCSLGGLFGARPTYAYKGGRTLAHGRSRFPRNKSRASYMCCPTDTHTYRPRTATTHSPAAAVPATGWIRPPLAALSRVVSACGFPRKIAPDGLPIRERTPSALQAKEQENARPSAPFAAPNLGRRLAADPLTVGCAAFLWPSSALELKCRRHSHGAPS